MILDGDKIWKLVQAKGGRGGHEADFLRDVSQRPDLEVLQEFVPRFE